MLFAFHLLSVLLFFSLFVAQFLPAYSLNVQECFVNSRARRSFVAFIQFWMIAFACSSDCVFSQVFFFELFMYVRSRARATFSYLYTHSEHIAVK